MVDPDVISGMNTVTDPNGNLEDFLPVLSEFMGSSSVVSTIKYGELPYKVKQMGFGVNVDWIISPKLIAKVNANLQKTTIDNYYAYDQNAEVLGQLGQVFGMIANVPNLANDMKTDAAINVMKAGLDPTAPENELAVYSEYCKAIQRAMIDVDDIEGLQATYAATENKEGMLTQLRNGEYGNGMSADDQYASYYALKYGVYNNDGIFYLGNSKQYEKETEDGVEHKATPKFYGMLGLIYKPTPKIDIAAYANYLGKRTYKTKYSTEELDDHFTVNLKFGYKPADGIEVYLSGKNLLNSEVREFPYGDKIGGIYSIGVSFGF